MVQVTINSAIASDRLRSVGGAVREQMAGARGRPAVRGWCLGVQGHDCARAWRGVSCKGVKQACCRAAGCALLCSRRMQRGWRLWRWEEEAGCALYCGSENILCSLYYSSMSSSLLIPLSITVISWLFVCTDRNNNSKENLEYVGPWLNSICLSPSQVTVWFVLFWGS